jgi:hypothetical protein
LHNELESIILDINSIGIEYDKVGFPTLKSNEYSELSYMLIKRKQVNWIEGHKSLKIKKVLHGGCLTCYKPEKEGIGFCLGCQFHNADWRLPDLRGEK